MHEDALCVPAALAVSLQPYEPRGMHAPAGVAPSDPPEPSAPGVHSWPLHVPQPAAQAVVALAGSADRTGADLAALRPEERGPDGGLLQLPAGAHSPRSGRGAELVPAVLVAPRPDQPVPIPDHRDPDPSSLVHPLHRDEEETGGVVREADHVHVDDAAGPSERERDAALAERLGYFDAHKHDAAASGAAQSQSRPDAPSVGLVAGLKAVMPIRLRERSAVDLVVVVLAMLVTVALLCVACSLHCGSLLLGVLSRLCPCCRRWLVARRGNRYGEEIQLKKTVYYDTANMDDDNL